MTATASKLRLKLVSRQEYPARTLALPIVVIFSWILGVALWGGAADSDRHFTLTQLAGTFLIFVAWALAAFGWGRFWSIWLGLDRFGPWSMAIASGAAWASWSAMILGHLGLIGYSWFPLLFCLMLAGPLACTYLTVKRGRQVTPLGLPCRGWEWPAYAAVGFVLVTWIGSGALAHGTTDPFFYHLLGPRQWVDAGRIEFFLGHASTFHCNYWEYIYIWGISLLGAPDGKGLMEGQFFGQWVHVVFGSVGCAVLLGAILEKLSIRRFWIPAAIAAALAAPPFRDYAPLAKNDMGAAMWCLAGVLLLCQFPKSRKDLALSGFFLGMGMCAKIPTAVSVVGAMTGWALVTWSRERKPGVWFHDVSVVVLGSVVPFVPLVLRNWYFAGNPAFPFFDPLFHSGLISLTDTFGSAGMMGKLSTPGQWVRNVVTALASTGPKWPFFFVVPLIPAVRRQKGVAVIAFGMCLFALSAFAIKTYSTLYVPSGYERWIGAGLLLAPCLAVAAAGDLVDWAIGKGARTFNKLHVPATLVATLASLVLVSPFVYESSRVSVFPALLDVSPDAALRDMKVNIGGATRAWLRLNTARGDKIVTTGEQLFYHVANLDIYSALRYPPIEVSLDGVNRPEVALDVLREFGFKYLVDIEHWMTRFYGPFAGIMIPYVEEKHPEAIVYSDPQSLIVDLDKLEEEVTQSCVAPVGTDESQFLRRFEYERRSAFSYQTCNPWRFSLDSPILRPGKS